MASIDRALVSPFSHTVDGPISVFTRIWHCRDEAFHQENISKIASVAANALGQTPRLTPAGADNHSLTGRVHKFLKQAKEYKSLPEVIKCQKEFLAFKLGISSSVLDETINPGFQRFASDEKDYLSLERYLIKYGHSLKEDARTHEVFIKYKGNMSPWSQVKGEALKPKQFVAGLPDLWNLVVSYESEGVTNDSSYDWKELKSRESKPATGDYWQWIACLSKPEIRLLGEHTWTVLETPKGELFSAGKYREDNVISTGMARKRAMIQSPDFSMYWKEDVHVLKKKITKEQFSLVKRAIVVDRREAQFQVFNQNCTSDSCNLLALTGTHIRPVGHWCSYFLPRPIYDLGLKISRALPSPLRAVAETIWAIVRYPFDVIGNLVAYCMGAGKISPTIANDANHPVPQINSFWEIFNPFKQEFYLPYLLAYDVEGRLQEAPELQHVVIPASLPISQYSV